jgi:hypothetical protein
VADQLSLIDEVNAKRGTRNMASSTPVVRTAIGKLVVAFNQKIERCYLLKGGVDTVRVETTDTDTIEKLLVLVPNLNDLIDNTEVKFDPMLDVEFKRHMGEDKFLHFEILSMVQRPGKPKAVVESKAAVDPAVTALKEAGEALDAAVTADSKPKWTADTSKPGQSQNIAAYKHFQNYAWDINRDLNVPAEAKIALAPHADIASAIEADGWPATRDKLQARLDYLKANPKTSTVVDKPKESTPVAHWSTVAKNVEIVKSKLAADAEAKHIAPDVVIAAAESAVGDMASFKTGADFILATLNEWRKPDESEPIDEIEGVADQDGEPAEASDVAAMDDEPPAAIAPTKRDEPAPIIRPDAIVKSTGELIALPRDANKAILHVKSTKALVDHMFNDKVLVAGVDYGTLPGARQDAKPSLLKPGAEKLLDAFQFYAVFKPTSNSVSDWSGDGFFNFEYEAVVCDRTSNRIEGSGIGSCNSKESKYRWRNAERVCPSCGQPAISKSKEEYGGGWYCSDKKGGCKTKFKSGDPRIEGQNVGKVENKDIFDLVNTLSKMAQKRALVAATLNATGASAVFTQDQTDFADFDLVD